MIYSNSPDYRLLAAAAAFAMMVAGIESAVMRQAKVGLRP
jgi:hypothetical protein